jgi:hypothetical protein
MPEDLEKKLRAVERQFEAFREGIPIPSYVKDRARRHLQLSHGSDVDVVDYEYYLAIEIIKDDASKGIRGGGAAKIRRGRYPKCFERRLALVIFVAERSVLGKRKDLIRISKEWNDLHQDDIMTPKTLGSEYYHAKKDPDVLATYFNKYNKTLAIQLTTMDMPREVFIIAGYLSLRRVDAVQILKTALHI